MNPERALQVVVTTSPAEAEIAADALWTLGATAVVEETLGDLVELRASLGNDEELIEDLLVHLEQAWRFEWVDLSVTDTWRQYATPTVVDDLLVIVPAWIDDAAATALNAGSSLRIRIEPGATFGLGNHPTTQACLRSLRDAVQRGDRVLDVGTGSGVLAVASVLLGASSAHGTDINPASLDIVALNAGMNAVAEQVTVTMDPLHAIDAPYDVVVANILAPTLIDLADDLVRLTGRTLVISGLLADRYQHVVDALTPLRVQRVIEVDGWVAIELTQ